jgi:hypothetical protein
MDIYPLKECGGISGNILSKENNNTHDAYTSSRPGHTKTTGSSYSNSDQGSDLEIEEPEVAGTVQHF